MAVVVVGGSGCRSVVGGLVGKKTNRLLEKWR